MTEREWFLINTGIVKIQRENRAPLCSNIKDKCHVSYIYSSTSWKTCSKPQDNKIILDIIIILSIKTAVLCVCERNTPLFLILSVNIAIRGSESHRGKWMVCLTERRQFQYGACLKLDSYEWFSIFCSGNVPVNSEQDQEVLQIKVIRSICLHISIIQLFFFF